MANLANGWETFWKGQRQSFLTVMKIATTFFALQIEKLFHLKFTDEILDYGCGPGFLSDHLTAKRISITGLDINQFYIEQCKRNHPESLFIPITTDIEENKKILDAHLHGKKFDFIILLSIAQYFKNVAELENVIRMLCPFMKASGKIILADVIDPKTSSLRDALSLLFQCVKKGNLISFFDFMFYLLFSNYRALSRKVKLLTLSEQSIGQIAKNNSLNCHKVKGLTIHASRTNYVLTTKADQIA